MSWGDKQDGSRMIVACKNTHKHACLLGGSGGIIYLEFRSSQIASDAIQNKLYNILMTHVADIDGTTIITILNFKISGRGNCGWGGEMGGGGWGWKFQPQPL